MIDLHSHILPGLDDGAKNLSEALDLARHAVASGITHAVLTPHIHYGRFNNDRNSIEKVFKEFKQSLINEQIDLQIGFAAEVRIVPEIMDWINQNTIPFLGRHDDKNVMMLELPHNHIPAGTENMVRWLISQNIIPMIVHPERNKEIMGNYQKIIPLYNLGCLFQLTAGAIAGQFGSASKATAEQLLKNNFVTILASDGHNLKHRPPELEPGRRAAELVIGESASWDLVRNNPESISKMHFQDATH